MRKSDLRMLATMMLIVSLVLPMLTAPAISAQSTGETASAVTRNEQVQRGMTLDCVNMSDSAREYAKKHKLCEQSTGGEVQPEGTVEGNCGISSHFITDLGNSYAKFDIGLASSLGVITYVWWNVNYFNYTLGGGAAPSGSGGNFSSVWTHTFNDLTGQGFVASSATGSVLLVWGGVCYWGPVSDAVTVTP